MNGSGEGSASKSAPGGVDPSMDDILASIRRILNEDDAPSGTPPPVADQEDVFILDNSMLVREPDAKPSQNLSSSKTTPAKSSYTEGTALVPEAISLTVHTPVSEEVAPMAPQDIQPAASPLVAEEAAAAASASMGTLLRSISSERHAAIYRGGPSIEEVVREEMRPILKQWLDTHLPDLVERLVRSEIERMAGHAKQ